MDNTITPPPVATGGKQKIVMAALIIFIVLAIVALAVYVNFMQPTVLPDDAAAPAVSTVGADIYNQAQNPVKDQIPETAAPVTNPIGDAYQNPF